MSMLWVAAGTAVVSAYGSYSSNQAANKSNSRAAANAKRRYALKAGVAESQMEEQKMAALEQMTDVTRKFLVAKGQAKVVQAETMVGGKVQERLKHSMALKESETKGKVAKAIDTNVINIAQDMLAEKVDTEAMVREALSRKKSGLTMLTEAGAAGASGYLTGSKLSGSIKKSLSD